LEFGQVRNYHHEANRLRMRFMMDGLTNYITDAQKMDQSEKRKAGIYGGMVENAEFK